MIRERIAPGRFRWRLTIAFVAVAAVSAGVIAGGSYVLVRNDRQASFKERSIRDARLAETVADTMLADGVIEPDEVQSFLGRFRRREFEAVVVLDDGTSQSTARVNMSNVPAQFLTGALSATPVEKDIRGTTYLMVPGSRAFPEARLFFFFPMSQLFESLSLLGGILWRLWLIVVVGAALVGSLVARRALRPVARASEAARALAEGLLDTRLPVETEDEFGAWAVSFNQMAEALQDKIDALVEARERERRFTSDVSHELRTPLTALVTSASMLEAELARMPTDLRWSFEQLIAQIRRVRRLLEELMEISRLDAGREVVELEPTKIDSLVRSIINQRGWLESVELEANGVMLQTDRRRLERVLSNLIENALEHGDSPVKILARPAPEEVVITVADSGEGLSEDERLRIFDRFYKGDPSRSGGTGLGLSIAQENARLLGGRIEVQSVKGHGATFSIRLPARETDEP